MKTKYAKLVTLSHKELFDLALLVLSTISRMGNVLTVRLHPANCYKQSYAIKREFLLPLPFSLEHSSVPPQALTELQESQGFSVI